MPLVAAVGQAGHGRVDTRDGDEERILDSRRRKLLPRSGRLLLLQLLAAACSSAKESGVEQFPTRWSTGSRCFWRSQESPGFPVPIV